jgi:hypothetical protein
MACIKNPARAWESWPVGGIEVARGSEVVIFYLTRMLASESSR